MGVSTSLLCLVLGGSDQAAARKGGRHGMVFGHILPQSSSTAVTAVVSPSSSASVFSYPLKGVTGKQLAHAAALPPPSHLHHCRHRRIIVVLVFS